MNGVLAQLYFPVDPVGSLSQPSGYLSLFRMHNWNKPAIGESSHCSLDIRVRAIMVGKSIKVPLLTKSNVGRLLHS